MTCPEDYGTPDILKEYLGNETHPGAQIAFYNRLVHLLTPNTNSSGVEKWVRSMIDNFPEGYYNWVVSTRHTNGNNTDIHNNLLFHTKNSELITNEISNALIDKKYYAFIKMQGKVGLIILKIYGKYITFHTSPSMILLINETYHVILFDFYELLSSNQKS